MFMQSNFSLLFFHSDCGFDMISTLPDAKFHSKRIALIAEQYKQVFSSYGSLYKGM